MIGCIYLFPFLEKLYLAFILFHQESLVTLFSGQDIQFLEFIRNASLSLHFIFSWLVDMTCLLLVEDGALKVENRKS